MVLENSGGIKLRFAHVTVGPISKLLPPYLPFPSLQTDKNDVLLAESEIGEPNSTVVRRQVEGTRRIRVESPTRATT